MPTEIKQCTPCLNTPAAQFQDARYGKQQRVHNETSVKDVQKKKFRCTVCGAER